MVGNYTKLTLLYVVLSRVTAGGGGRNYTHDYSCVVMFVVLKYVAHTL